MDRWYKEGELNPIQLKHMPQWYVENVINDLGEQGERGYSATEVPIVVQKWPMHARCLFHRLTRKITHNGAG
jgi:hypothetical protein